VTLQLRPFAAGNRWATVEAGCLPVLTAAWSAGSPWWSGARHWRPSL